MKEKELKAKRRLHLPSAALNKEPLVPAEAPDIEIYTYVTHNGRHAAMLFQGKAAKPLWHVWFHNDLKMAEKIQESIASRKAHLEAKAERRQQQSQQSHGLQVGDILSSSWGYGQTNITFYQVTNVMKSMVEIRRISAIHDHDNSNEYQDALLPSKDSFVGEPMRKRPSVGDKYVGIRISSYEWASKWNGQPEYATNPMFGH